MRTKGVRNSITALFFVLLTFIGLVTAVDYTGSYDELAEQAILESNLKEYALRLESLGIKWPYGLALNAQPISQSIERDHGISAYYLFPFIFSCTNGSEWWRFVLWNAMTWLWFMTGVWSLYAVARKMGASQWVGMAAALLLYCSPRLFAEGHYNNKDIVLLCQTLLCLWMGARFWEKPSVARALLFAICGALACNTKIVGALVWGLMTLSFLIRTCRKKDAKHICTLLACILGFLATYWLLTPALWDDPFSFFRYLIQNAASFSRWSGTLYFRGASFEIPDQALPVYYLPYMISVTIPLFVLPLILLGQFAFLVGAWKEKGSFLSETKGMLLTSATLVWLLPMLAFFLARPTVYNGWRHFYFCFAGLAAIAAYGLIVLLRACRSKKWRKRLYTVGLALCFGLTTIGMVMNHPNQGAYYNPLASRATMETDYWNSAGTGALKRLAAFEGRNSELPLEVGCYFFDIQNARFKLDDLLKARITTTVKEDSPYLYYIENYVQIYNIPKPEGYHVLFTVESYGRLIATMYEKDV